MIRLKLKIAVFKVIKFWYFK